MKHTPGPWKANTDDCEIVGGMGFVKIETVDETIHEGEFPCHVALAYGIDTHVFPHLGCSDANAKLIAAAPDLLKACRIAATSIEVAINVGAANSIGFVEAHKILCETIAKAES